MNNNDLYIFGISGGTCSGKTYLSKSIQKYFGKEKINIIKLDSYYHDLAHLKFEDREKNNFDHPRSFDFELLYQHLSNIINNQTIEIPIYDYKTHTRTQEVEKIFKTKIIIIEGILTLYDKKIRNLMYRKIFLEKPTDLRKNLRLKRDKKHRARTNESINLQYTNSVEPMYIKYVEKTKKYADIIIKEDTIKDSNAFAILSKEINQILN